MLTAEDSGTAAAPLVITGAPDGSTTLSGARIVVPSPRPGAMLTIDLPDRTGTRWDAPYGFGYPGVRQTPILFQGDQRFELSSWPERGYVKNITLSRQAKTLEIAPGGAHLADGDRVLVAGYLGAVWAFQALPGTMQRGRVVVDATNLPLPPSKSTQLRFTNVGGTLAPLRMRMRSDTSVSMRSANTAPIELAAAASLLTLQGVSNVRIERLALEKTSGSTITAINATSVTLSDCFVGLAGRFGIEVDQGRDITIRRCVVSGTGLGGVRLNGGDRQTLTPANHRIVDSIVENTGLDSRTGYPAVAIAGVGSHLTTSAIRNTPSTGVSIDGNDNGVTDSEIANTVCEANDAGAVYMGRDWTQRGNVVRGNYIHDVGGKSPADLVSAIYLDDQFSGAAIVANTIIGAPFGIVLGGGRDNVIQDNDFSAIGNSAIQMDNRGENSSAGMAGIGGELRTRLEQSPYLTTLWQSRYPELAHILQNGPGKLVGNIASGNRYADTQWLWTQPLGLRLAGRDNIGVHMTPDQGVVLAIGSAIDRFKLVHTLLRRSQSSPPGPPGDLPYAARSHQPICPGT